MKFYLLCDNKEKSGNFEIEEDQFPIIKLYFIFTLIGHILIGSEIRSISRWNGLLSRI